MREANRSRIRSQLLATTSLILASLAIAPAFAGNVLPSGGSVASGSVTISQPNTTTLNINQSTNQAIINWNTFSVGRGDTVNFNQPGASSSTLNRVTSNTPSWIAGTINAPGTVLLVNPNGIEITKSGIVNTGSFAASTLNIKDSDYLSGNYNFSGNGASAGVINNGRINVADGGFAALLGGQATNNGIIAARLGFVALGAGEQATLDLSGDGFLSVAIPSSELGHLVSANGALVSNNGKINANGGTVFLSAATAQNILRNAVNMGGVIRANSVGTHDGKIVLNGGGGNVKVTGTLLAKNKRGTGGEIDITSAGAGVTLIGALIDASGKTGGGVIDIGGDAHGNGPLANALTTDIDATTIIRADATDKGNGGEVVVWSDQNTTFAGQISAKGGRNGGNGGSAEVSGKVNLTLSGFANLSAAQGLAGTLLLDPGSVNIVHGGNSYLSADTFNDAYLSAELGVANIVVDTNDATGANGTTGDITLLSNAAISWTAATTLTLNAANNIVFQSNSSITAHGGSVVLNAGDNASGVGTVEFPNSGTQITVTGGGSVTAYYNPTSFPTANFASNNASAVSVTGGGSLTAYMLVNNASQLEAINGNLSGDYALSTSINMGTIGVNDLDDNLFNGTGSYPFCAPCLEPLGTFSGIFNGRGNTLTFTMYSGDGSQALFQQNNGVITNLNVSVTAWAGTIVGGIAGFNNGTIENSSATLTAGAIFDPNNGNSFLELEEGFVGISIGGLVGVNNPSGKIINSTASFTNNGIGQLVGGLVGDNRGTISGSGVIGGTISVPSIGYYNPGMTLYVGGLAGLNDGGGTITTSYSLASISDFSGNYYISYDGGFVGQNVGTISSSFATGAVTTGLDGGGFVGDNEGIIDTSFSTGNVHGTGTNTTAGGFAGTSGYSGGAGHPLVEVNDSYSTGSVTTSGLNLAGGGFFGYSGGTNSNDYWDTTTSGWTSAGTNFAGAASPCGCGVSSVQSATSAAGDAFSAYSYSSAFLAAGWYVDDGWTRPLPTAFRTSTITTSVPLVAAIELELIGSAPSANYALGTNINLAVTSSSRLWSSAGFGPIASFNQVDIDGGSAFSGIFNGAGYTISNLNINGNLAIGASPDQIGLFGVLTGTVENLGLVGGTVQGTQGIGALVAINNGGAIETSYSTVNVLTQGGAAGGLVAQNNGGTISNSYSTGNVTNGNNNNSNGNVTGGIAGSNDGTITDVYYAGTASGGHVGGIVGYNENASPAVGAVSNAYWNTDLTAAGVGVSDAGTTFSGNGLSTLAMENLSNFQTTYAGFNFDTIWAPPNQAGQGGDATANYPELYADSLVIWVDAASATTTYGTALTQSAATLYGLHDYDLPSVVQGLVLSSAGGSSPDVGSYAISESGATATSTDGSTYRFVTTGTLTVDQLALTGTVTITGINKPYDGTASASGGSAALNALNGVINGDSLSLSATAGTYANGPNAGGTEIVNLTGVMLTGPKANDYTLGSLTYSGSGTITPALLTVSGTKVYDATTGFALNELAIAGGVNGETVTLISGTGTSTSANAGTYASSSLSGLAISVTGSNTLTSNYQLPTTGALTINRDPVTVTAATNTKTYDGTNSAANTPQVSGTLYDSATLSETYTTANAGTGLTLQPNVSFSTPSAASNYQITYVDNFTGVINQAALTYTANTASMTYGGTVPGLSGTVTGFVGNDTLANATGGTAVWTTTATSTSIVGSYSISGAGLTANNSNYTFQQATPNATAFTVNKALLTITANDQSMTYGGAANSLIDGVTVAGLLNINGDSVTGETLKTNATVSSTSGFWNAGNWTITASAATGSGLSNYTITYKAGALDVAQQAITISAVSGSKTYDGTTFSSLTPTVATLVTGDKVLGLSESYNSPDVLTANTLSVNGGFIIRDGNGGRNYAVTLATAAGTIAPATVTLNGAKAYDSTTAFNSDDFGIGGTILTGVGLQTLTVTGGGSVGSANVIAGVQTLNTGSLALANGTGLLGGLASNYKIATTGNTGTVIPATIAIAGTKVYDGNGVFTAADFGTDGTINTGINSETLNVTGSGFVLSPNVSAGTQLLVPIGLGLANDTGLASNYRISLLGNTGVITPATLTYNATPNGMVYGGTVPTLSGMVTGFVGSQNLASATTGTLTFTTTANALSDVGTYAITGSGLTADHGNYVFVQAAANATAFTVSPATLTYVADPSVQFIGTAFPTFTGTVTGFVNNQSIATATMGTLLFSTTATPSSAPGSYPIDGSGLTANHNNYVFVQAASNATALTLNQQPAPPPNPTPPPTTPNTQVSINFSNQGGTFARVSFTPNGPNNNGVNPSALPPGNAFMHNNGLYFPPISQYDSDQYSDFKAPAYDNDDSEATVLTILARGIAQAEAAQYMIDGFWNGSEDTWPGATHVDLLGKAVFSDGAGHDVTPTNNPAFPIVAGKTDFAALLKNGPVMIGGPSDQTPAQWLLAVSMTPDGKGIICDDTQTGGLVELAYDPLTQTIGGITQVFDAKTNGFIALADAGNDIPKNDAAGLPGLQNFTPSTYYAVTVH